jgi:hypothetical protein
MLEENSQLESISVVKEQTFKENLDIMRNTNHLQVQG